MDKTIVTFIYNYSIKVNTIQRCVALSMRYESYKLYHRKPMPIIQINKVILDIKLDKILRRKYNILSKI